MTPEKARELLQQAQAYANAGRFPDAIELCKRVLKNRPREFGANYFAAILHAQQGQLQDAIPFFQSAIDINPNIPDARYNFAYALNLTGRNQEAVEHYEAVLKASPQHLNALVNYANTLSLIDRASDALTVYDTIIGLTPESPAGYVNRSLVFKELKKFDAAIADCDKAITLEPRYAEAHVNRGIALHEQERFTEALESYNNAIRLRAGYTDAYFNRGVTLHDLRRLDEAIASYDEAIKLKPDFAGAYFNRGTTFHEMKELDASIESYDKALSIKADHRYTLARGMVNLLRGNFDAGWREYEWRSLRQEPVASEIARQPLWDGVADITGKKILVYAEQGLGDTIQFCRYLKLLQRDGVDVLFAPQPSLKEIMKSLEPGVALVDVKDPSLQFDVRYPLLSLPRAYGTVRDTIPADVPYLFADPERAKEWAGRIGEHGFKIGICWQGGITKVDVGRSFHVREFLPLAQIENVRLISLHKGQGEAQLSTLPAGKIETLGENFDAGPNAFLDTAAVMEGLDLIVTSDTGVAHLAGALGKPTWVALQYVPDWRWLLDRDDSPWYPTMRLFRQKEIGDWGGVLAEMRAALTEQMQSSGRAK